MGRSASGNKRLGLLEDAVILRLKRYHTKDMVKGDFDNIVLVCTQDAYFEEFNKCENILKIPLETREKVMQEFKRRREPGIKGDMAREKLRQALQLKK